MTKKYALKYTHIHETNYGKGFTKEEIIKAQEENPDVGAADAIILISIVRDGKKAHDGAVSFSTVSEDGQNRNMPIPDTELFSAWASLAHSLYEGGFILDWQKEIVKKAVENVRMIMKHKKEKKGLFAQKDIKH
jgi:hypothetical protein